jgi:amino acid adenylation domain-containing protein/non-ribosomal peptide synthase protein (TIGR01720 family)
MSPETRDILDSFPLSPMQQGMLFHHLKDPRSGVDIEQLVVHLPEFVAAPRLQAAWQWLVHRHDILRAEYVWDDDQPLQNIVSEVEVPFTVEDARHLSEPDQHSRLQSFLEADRKLGFELNCAPLLRLRLFQWSDAKFSLVWTFHHALLDGRSYPVLLREVFNVYAELENGGIVERPAPYPYRRYIDWLQQKDFSIAESYWKGLLNGFTAPTPLVVDKLIRLEADIYTQGESWERLDKAATAQLRILAERHGLTMNSLVMGAWSILLHRYSGEEDIVFAATRACRKSSVPHADDTVGLFINTVPVRVKVSGEEQAISVCKRIRSQWLEMRPYEHTPLSRIKAASQIPPVQPLFETLLVFEKYLLDTTMRSLGGAWTKRQVELHELTNFPITLAAYDDDQLSFKIEFDRRRLDDDTVRRLLGHLRRLLEGMAGNPHIAVLDLPLVSDDEARQLIHEFNTPVSTSSNCRLPINGDSTLHGLFEAEVVRRPDALALTCDGQSLTYRELNACANRLARNLVECGVGPDTLVGLCLDRSNELVIAILAILKAGGAYLPIDLAYPADRLAFMVDDAEAPVLLTQSKLKSRLPATNATVLCVDELLARPISQEEERNLSSAVRPDHLAYVIYTSGTTGKPKGSLITHRNVVRLLASTEHWFGFDDRDVWTLFHSCAFDFSVWEIWGALLYGGRLVVVPFMLSRSPEAFFELVAQEKVTVLNQTPSAFRQFIQAEASVGNKELALRYVIFGGEALEMQSLRPWFDRHEDHEPRLVNMYGITETTVHVTYRPISKHDLESGSVIGVPIPDLKVFILDAGRKIVPIGVPGEIYVGGSGLARGYLRRPELTRDRFVQDHITGQPSSRLYRTGDLGRFLPSGDIEYLGRIDDQVKIRGFRIELGEIESVLCQHPAVQEASVMARQDQPGSKRLVAYLVTHRPAPAVNELRDHLKKKLPEYMVPAAFVFLDRLPLTNNGKIDRKALPVPEQHRPELAGRYVSPSSPEEKKLAEIWSKVLRVERVGIHDNFFELGGDSILSIRVVALARGEGIPLTPTLLFDNPTVAELGVAAKIASKALPNNEIVTAAEVPLTPIQQWFFEQELEDLHHYNQAFLFEVLERLDRDLLKRALDELSKQHDSLRLRYVRDAGHWRQRYSLSPETVPLGWESLVGLSAAEQVQRIEQAATASQGALNLESGPLWRATYFDFGDDQPGRLLLVVHHLAIDGVSWRPLLEDLESVYQQLKAGNTIQLPAKTTPYQTWAERLCVLAKSESVCGEIPYWSAVTEPNGLPPVWKSFGQNDSALNLEGSSDTVKVSFTQEETQALLQKVPAAYNTQINDVLLTALARAWSQWSGSRVLFTNLEGHGRENLFDDVDLSRTIGWFTAIFPVRLELPEAGDNWQPGEALKSIKEQLRQIPQRGIGYGILRYLSGAIELAACIEPSMVFNYLGQFDQVVAGSKLFRFARESSGPWHSPTQRRRYAIEVNSLVTGGRLEVAWTYSRNTDTEPAMRQLPEAFASALRDVITHCQIPSVFSRTVSDFPLARLGQSALDRLLAGKRDIDDIYGLSPIQTLFFSASAGTLGPAFDQWHCTLRGDLNVSAFQDAWRETVCRHTILRSSIYSDGLAEPVQIVHRDAEPKWKFEDWRTIPVNQHAERWVSFLKQDRAQPLHWTEVPVMRFTLVRLTGDSWKFLWSVPALLLDGWSWPVVFQDVSRLYAAYSQGGPSPLEPAHPYRDYLKWLNRRSDKESRDFWRANLAGFREPTALPREATAEVLSEDTFIEQSVEISAATTAALLESARRLQVTLNTLLQSAWALLLSRQSGSLDVVFGAAFAGRPTDLRGADSIVGPFVNNLPVRVSVDRESILEHFFRQLQSRSLELSRFQFTPLTEIQSCSEVPWQHRLFDSMVVFQNYAVDESVRRFGEAVVADFVGPIHTNYPLMLVVDPGQTLRITLIYDRRVLSGARIGHLVRDLVSLFEQIPSFCERRVGDLLELLSPPPTVHKAARPKLRVESQNFVPPQTEMERTIAGLWQRMFGIEQLSVEDKFFDLGGHSLLLLQMHSQLREVLKIEVPIVRLLEYSTVRSLARHLDQSRAQAPRENDNSRERAHRQKQALSQLRERLKK